MDEGIESPSVSSSVYSGIYSADEDDYSDGEDAGDAGAEDDDGDGESSSWETVSQESGDERVCVQPQTDSM